MTQSDWMVVGRVAGPFGIHGELKVEPYTDEPDRFLSFAALYLEPWYRRLQVDLVRRHKKVVVVKLVGIDTPEAVRELGTFDVSIPRTDALTLAEGQYFLEDMLGMTAVTEKGQVLGRVADVLRTGANDVFVVRGDGIDVLIPGTREAVPRIDMKGRTLAIAEWALQPYQ
ncbi:MAG: ribosome maturation factor RimM [Chloroflexota bacterium]|nr:MAG: 16S rRNA processing protein RimM [Chloroflexota bacterium]